MERVQQSWLRRRYSAPTQTTRRPESMATITIKSPLSSLLRRTVMNNEKCICWLLVANDNYFTSCRNPRALYQRMPTGPPVVGSHYRTQLEMMYTRNITSGKSSPRQSFFLLFGFFFILSLTPPMIVSVSAKWTHASWMPNAGTHTAGKHERLFRCPCPYPLTNRW